jgi:hypothetical protein
MIKYNISLAFLFISSFIFAQDPYATNINWVQTSPTKVEITFDLINLREGYSYDMELHWYIRKFDIEFDPTDESLSCFNQFIFYTGNDAPRTIIWDLSKEAEGKVCVINSDDEVKIDIGMVEITNGDKRKIHRWEKKIQRLFKRRTRIERDGGSLVKVDTKIYKYKQKKKEKYVKLFGE